MTVHHLKIVAPLFEDVLVGVKTFEVRINDRGFEVGDVLMLHEFLGYDRGYTGATVRAKVTYMCDIPSVEGMVGMSIEVVK